MQLLILACSQTKSELGKPLPAKELYTGVFYSVLNKAIRENSTINDKLSLYIISAKYGLISGEAEIENYDLRMTDKIAKLQIDNNTRILHKIIAETNPSEIMLVMGRTYRSSIDTSNIRIPVNKITGSIGFMLRDFKVWLSSLEGCL